MFAIAITLATALAAIIALALRGKKKIKNNHSEFYQIAVQEIDYSKPANPLDNLRVGEIVWRDGLRYYITKDGSEVRFESSEEPLTIDGKYFTGKSAAGEYFWAEEKREPGDIASGEVSAEVSAEAKSATNDEAKSATNDEAKSATDDEAKSATKTKARRSKNAHSEHEKSPARSRKKPAARSCEEARSKND